MTDLQFKILDLIYNPNVIIKVHDSTVGAFGTSNNTKNYRGGKMPQNSGVSKKELIKQTFILCRPFYISCVSYLLKEKYLFIQKSEFNNSELLKLSNLGIELYQNEDAQTRLKKWYDKPMIIGIGSALVSAIATALLTFLLTNQSAQLEYKKQNEKLLYLEKRIDTLYPHPITNQKKK